MSTSTPASPSPFGLILPSRAILTDPQIITPTQCAFTFAAAPAFSHIVIFLLPTVTLPEGMVAAIYIQYPPAIPEFRLLGAIANEKPSAIFQIDGLAASDGGGDISNGAGSSMSTDVPGDRSVVTVGLSVEPAMNLAPQLEALALKSGPAANPVSSSSSTSSTALVTSRGVGPQNARGAAASPISTKLLAQRIIKNAFNFLASFAGSTTVGGQEVVPLKSFQDWWVKFERRVENDPGFLERQDDG